MIEVLAVLLITALATSVLGVFLVLKGQAMTTDAISHTILLGIVLAFFITNDLRSPLLIIGATVIGLITVYLIELVTASRLMKQDAAIGIVFTALFAIAVILVSRYADNVHLDIDIVLMGQVLFAPLNRIDILGLSLPYALVQLTIILIINSLFVLVCYKELKVTSFDPVYATVAGFSTTIIYYILMSLVSVTAVTAFDAVGSILVISFFVAPAITAYLITKRLSHMIWISLLVASFNSIAGGLFGYYTDISISGSVASFSFVTFLAVFLFNKNGMINKAVKARKQSSDFTTAIILQAFYEHRDLSFENIRKNFNLNDKTVAKQLNKLENQNYIDLKNNKYTLTTGGEKYAVNLFKKYDLPVR